VRRVDLARGQRVRRRADPPRGGSAQAGKPVIVSMSDVAASGGLLGLDVAPRKAGDPATITARSGFGMVQTFDKEPSDKVGCRPEE